MFLKVFWFGPRSCRESDVGYPLRWNVRTIKFNIHHVQYEERQNNILSFRGLVLFFRFVALVCKGISTLSI